jgi:putative oxidoreductase
MDHLMCRGGRHRRAHRIHSTRHDLGLLALRLGTGGVLFAHGAQKLFGWFGGHGLEGTGGFMEQIGFRPGRGHALASGLGEAGGGTLVALGLGTPGAGAAVAAAMAGAASVHAPAGFFNDKGGVEYPAYLALVGSVLALSGPGRFSLDHVLKDRLNQPWMPGVTLAAAAAGAAVVIARRMRAQQEEGAQPA